MSKTDILNSLQSGESRSENPPEKENMEQTMENLMEKARKLHEQEVANAKELEALLKPLAEAMYTLTETTRQSMSDATTMMEEHKKDFYGKLQEAAKAWGDITHTVNAALDPLQEVRKTWNTVMQEMRETAKITSDNAQKTQLLVSAGRWIAVCHISYERLEHMEAVGLLLVYLRDRLRAKVVEQAGDSLHVLVSRHDDLLTLRIVFEYLCTAGGKNAKDVVSFQS